MYVAAAHRYNVVRSFFGSRRFPLWYGRLIGGAVGCGRGGLFCRVRSGGRDRGHGDGSGDEDPRWPDPRSSHLPKIILPAVVCRTEVTETSMVLPIILRRCRRPPWCRHRDRRRPVVFFSFFQNEDAHDLAGQNDGLRELASSLMLSTATPALGDFVEIEVVVRILPS